MEHARKASTKPLFANRPGENGVAHLTFIEGRNEVKTPILYACGLGDQTNYRISS